MLWLFVQYVLQHLSDSDILGYRYYDFASLLVAVVHRMLEMFCLPPTVRSSQPLLLLQCRVFFVLSWSPGFSPFAFRDDINKLRV